MHPSVSQTDKVTIQFCHKVNIPMYRISTIYKVFYFANELTILDNVQYVMKMIINSMYCNLFKLKTQNIFNIVVP